MTLVAEGDKGVPMVVMAFTVKVKNKEFNPWPGGHNLPHAFFSRRPGTDFFSSRAQQTLWPGSGGPKPVL
jgi:hypothetical protein